MSWWGHSLPFLAGRTQNAASQQEHMLDLSDCHVYGRLRTDQRMQHNACVCVFMSILLHRLEIAKFTSVTTWCSYMAMAMNIYREHSPERSGDINLHVYAYGPKTALIGVLVLFLGPVQLHAPTLACSAFRTRLPSEMHVRSSAPWPLSTDAAHMKNATAYTRPRRILHTPDGR